MSELVDLDDLAEGLAKWREVLAYFRGLDRSDFSAEELELERQAEEQMEHFLDMQEIALQAHRRAE